MTSDSPSSTRQPPEPLWLTGLVRAEPRAPFMFPYLAYLLVMAFQDMVPAAGWNVFIAIHIAIVVWVCLLFRRHYPALGKPHLMLAVLMGAFAALLWVAGQKWLDGVSLGSFNLGGRLPFYPGHPKPYDPHSDFGGASLGAYMALKIFRSVTVVPFVEEMLWRGFLLRALVSWDRYETVPWGKFSWRAMIATSLISTVQHPDNWGVSIGCWLLFNALFYWKKSLLFLMLTHAVTNLVLYCYVIGAGDWRFW